MIKLKYLYDKTTRFASFYLSSPHSISLYLPASPYNIFYLRNNVNKRLDLLKKNKTKKHFTQPTLLFITFAKTKANQKPKLKTN